MTRPLAVLRYFCRHPLVVLQLTLAWTADALFDVGIRRGGLWLNYLALLLMRRELRRHIATHHGCGGDCKGVRQMRDTLRRAGLDV